MGQLLPDYLCRALEMVSARALDAKPTRNMQAMSGATTCVALYVYDQYFVLNLGVTEKGAKSGFNEDGFCWCGWVAYKSGWLQVRFDQGDQVTQGLKPHPSLFCWPGCWLDPQAPQAPGDAQAAPCPPSLRGHPRPGSHVITQRSPRNLLPGHSFPSSFWAWPGLPLIDPDKSHMPVPGHSLSSKAWCLRLLRSRSAQLLNTKEKYTFLWSLVILHILCCILVVKAETKLEHRYSGHDVP